MELKDKNLYYVGGVVRDEILGLPSFDIDFCYEGNAIEFAKNSGLNIIKENPDFGTVRIYADGYEIDIASTREEIYPKPGHLPVVKKIGCSLEEDLKRRDFTVNAMAKNTLTGEIIDYFNSLEDLKAKKLRVLHSNSFIDDPSRILRSLKFSTRFGFELEEQTKFLQDEYLKNINYDMSYHRIKKELRETFNLNKDSIWEVFIKNNIYKLLGEELSLPSITGSISKLVDAAEDIECVWIAYAGLFDLKNLDLTKEECEIITAADNLVQTTFKNSCDLYCQFAKIPIESVILWGLVRDYDLAYHYLRDLKNIKPVTTGNDLIEMGIERGKLYKEIFDFIAKEKFKNPALSKEEELELIKNKYL